MYIFNFFLMNTYLVHCVIAQTFYFESNPFDQQNTLLASIRKAHILEADLLSSFNEIENLPSILSLFGAYRCLLCLDNYFGKDLPYLEYPAIFRKLVPTSQQFRQDGFGPAKRMSWFPAKMSAANLSGSEIPCPTSNILTGVQTNGDDFCIKIDIHQFVTRSKPWNCQIDVSLFLPTYSMNFHLSSVLGQTPFFNFQTFLFYYSNIPPSTKALSIQLFIVKNIQSNPYTPEQLDEKLIHLRSMTQMDSPIHLVNHDVTIISEVTFPVGSKSGRITSTRVACKLCVTTKSSEIILFPNNLKLLHSIGFPKPTEMLFWRIDQILDKGKVTDGVIDHMSKCELNVEPSGESHKVMKEFAHVFRAIMKNYSYAGGYGWPAGRRCENGKWTQNNFQENFNHLSDPIQLTSKSYSGKIPFQFPLVARNNRNGVQFIACGGQVHINSLSFKEFVSGFDLYIWLFTSLSVFVVAVLLRISVIHDRVRKPNTRYFETIFGLLLGQFDQYQFTLPQISSRCLLSGFGLTAIVLSNAYKNDNIYRMALPRQQIYLDTLDDIFKNNFTVFTRTSQVVILPGWMQTQSYSNIELQSVTLHDIRDTGLNYLFMQSELSDILTTNGAHETIDLNIETSLYLNSKLHPKIFQILKDTITGSIYFNNRTWYELPWSNVEDHLKKLFWKSEEEYLINELRLCKNVAVVVPPKKRNDLAKQTSFRNFKSMKSRQHLGKEVFYKSYTIFSLGGVVPPFIILRMKQIECSGILEWWTTLLRGEKATQNSGGLLGSELQKPTMEGNIMTVFVVMLGGHVLSILVFVSELLQILCKKCGS